MIYSMTGYAVGSREVESGVLNVELRSVNHRYLDVQLRTPGAAPFGFRHTFHLVRAGSRWRWLLSPGRYRLYARRGCGEAPGL